jgi:DUF438 domain-containing protein
MWALHDDIRGMIKKLRRRIEQGESGDLAADGKEMVTAVEDMIYKEENILFPMALETLSESEWGRVLAGSNEIGYTLIEPDTSWAPADGPIADAPPERRGGSQAPIWLSTGGLTTKQLDLVLTNLPVDLTFVDAEDKVQYYSASEHRIFPRSAGIIGRDVQNCHPSSSVHIVKRILDAFRNGEKDTADFWIQIESKFILIRYLAIRNEDGRYEGCLEVSQDVTKIKGLDGERRLLDW